MQANIVNASSRWNINDVKNERLASIVFSTAAFLCTAYIVVALVAYGIKRDLWKCLCDLYIGYRSSDFNASIIHTTTLVAALSALAFIIIDFPHYMGAEEPFCVAYLRVKIASTAFGLFSVYFTLWYRVHHVFYSNPMLKKSASAFARVLSKATVVLLVVMVTINLVTFYTSDMYETTPVGCMRTNSNNRLKWGVLLCSTVLFQGLLLFSLFYPLSLHRRKLRERGIRSRSIRPLVKRAAFTAAICIASDAANAIYAVINRSAFVYLRQVVHGANLMINLIALLLSFNDWKEKLFPYCHQNSVGREQNVATIRIETTQSMKF